MKKRYYYLIELQFLGFRFHGWQKQSDVKTLQGMVDKTICFIEPEVKFKTLGAGRTDAFVSSSQYFFELFIFKKLDAEDFLEQLNKNLPSDIRAMDVKEVSEDFNVISDAKLKEYMYLFSYGEKNHPFCAPFIVNIQHNLDIELMKEGAALFVGEHSFKSYSYRPSAETVFKRTIDFCEISENTLYTANFFPKNSYAFHVHAKGFMRHQVRLMMGTLMSLGQGEISLDDIRDSLAGNRIGNLGFSAPGSGLMLNKTHFMD